MRRLPCEPRELRSERERKRGKFFSSYSFPHQWTGPSHFLPLSLSVFCCLGQTMHVHHGTTCLRPSLSKQMVMALSSSHFSLSRFFFFFSLFPSPSLIVSFTLSRWVSLFLSILSQSTLHEHISSSVPRLFPPVHTAVNKPLIGLTPI